jgi:hypothetical protein
MQRGNHLHGNLQGPYLHYKSVIVSVFKTSCTKHIYLYTLVIVNIKLYIIVMYWLHNYYVSMSDIDLHI